MALRLFLIAPSALLTDHRPHGDGLVAFGFVRELAARGHELHVLAGRVDVRDPLPANVQVYGGAPRAGPDRSGFMRRLWGLYRRLRRAGSFDLVHQLTPVEVGVSLAVPDTRVPLVLGPYVPDWPASGAGADTPVSSGALRLKRVLRAAQQRRASMVLLSTPAAASKLERRAGPSLRVRELPFGIDERSWRPAADREPGQDVLFLANVETRKGIHVLIDAFAELTPRLPAARLTVAGAGRELDALRERVRTSPALHRVRLVGHVERDRVMATIHDCDVYCLPSYGEPFGMSALEAMACGKPVVATNAGGLGHLVPDEGGYKVPVGDVSALSAALYEALVSPDRRREMGAYNRRLVEQRYAWARVVDRLEDAYDAALYGA